MTAQVDVSVEDLDGRGLASRAPVVDSSVGNDTERGAADPLPECDVLQNESVAVRTLPSVVSLPHA